ncbi:hypothetical protein [Pseudophaeobacter flagellatus]|uniref:hypothetical protein n=1 Tax=Pseudophaeobacter flagellatus TaxID=2899119 RepID=UPI001E29AEBC|nr:hypothetical protein [Pseudophaeobacter flagellatus]MCD9146632.1 hypothetical protein [Pseudophaeobacter flagellatus]
MFEEMEKILNLEASALVTVAVGYLGFRVAYAERANPENTAQTIFLSICFAAFFQVSLSMAAIAFSGDTPPVFHQVSAASATLIASVLWRRVGMKQYARFWLGTGGTHLDGLSTVLDTIRTDTEFKPTSLLVSVDDGPILYCDDLQRFKKHPFGPCLIGGDGSIALYVTHTQPSGVDEWEETEEHAQNQITVIPADRVKLIETRVGK